MALFTARWTQLHSVVLAHSISRVACDRLIFNVSAQMDRWYAVRFIAYVEIERITDYETDAF